MRTFKLCVFPGAMNLPLFVAIEQGFLAARGLGVDVHPTRGSVEQLVGAINGEFEIIMTAIDNVVAYDEGQGEVAVDGTPELFAFFGQDDAYLNLVARPEIGSVAELRGKEVAVDAITTGFAFVLRQMLANAGVGEDEVEWIAAGGLVQRFAALTAGNHHATLMNTPFDLMAAAAGLHTLQRGRDAVPHYQGVVAAANRSWAAANEDAVVGYTSAHLDAIDWLYDPANRVAAADVLVANLPQMAREIAETTCALFVDPETGLARDGALDRAGIAGVLELRNRFGTAAAELTDPDAYIDTSYWEKARAGR